MLDSTGPTRRVYRARSPGSASSRLYGGTVAGGLSAVTTAVNRVSGLLELDCAIRLQLVANNDL